MHVPSDCRANLDLDEPIKKKMVQVNLDFLHRVRCTKKFLIICWWKRVLRYVSNSGPLLAQPPGPSDDGKKRRPLLISRTVKIIQISIRPLIFFYRDIKGHVTGEALDLGEWREAGLGFSSVARVSARWWVLQLLFPLFSIYLLIRFYDIGTIRVSGDRSWWDLILFRAIFDFFHVKIVLLGLVIH